MMHYFLRSIAFTFFFAFFGGFVLGNFSFDFELVYLFTRSSEIMLRSTFECEATVFNLFGLRLRDRDLEIELLNDYFDFDLGIEL